MEDFKNRVNKTKKKINEAKLSKEFKDNLKIIMDKEYYKGTNENSKVRLVENKNSTFRNTKLKLLYPKKIAAIFLCLIIISSLTFAGDWENFFAKIFYNMDESMSLAIEEGYIQNIDMDYVECNGIKIKVDYILFDEQRLYIAFNVNTKKECNDVDLNNFFIEDQDDRLLYNFENNYTDILFKTERRKIDSNSIILLSKFENINTLFNNIKKIHITINSVEIKDSKQSSLVQGEWNLDIDVEKLTSDYNIEKIDAYFENSEKLINKYDIKLTLISDLRIDEIKYIIVDGERYRDNTPLPDRVGPAISYNSGTMLSGASDLYRVTGDKVYSDDMISLSDNSFSYFAKLDAVVKGYYYFEISGFNNWFNGVLMRGYADVRASYPKAADYLNAFQDNLDYAYENFNYEHMLPTNLLVGWNKSETTKNNVEGMFTFAFAAEYAVLANIEWNFKNK